MPITPEQLANINNSALDVYLSKGTVFKQNVLNKPMLKAFDAARGKFSGGKEYVSVGVKSGQGGGSLTGYTWDDQVSYYNPATTKHVNYPWKEHHIGITVPHTELKVDGITVTETRDGSSTRKMDGREQHALANILEEKYDDLGEDYAKSLDELIHGDGSSDAKALAGIKAFILDVPGTGTTGGLSRVTNAWWRNRAATAANGSAGGQGAITSATTDGGALLTFLEKENRQLTKYAQGGVKHKCFAGSSFLDAVAKELRANGNYTLNGWRDRSSINGGMNTMGGIPFNNWFFEYDPTLDELSLDKRAYVIDMRRIKLMYMDGERMHRHTPARPYDRYTMYSGITTTAAMCAQQLNTSGVYDIA